MKLHFVYNANSGFLDKILDGAHKIVSPSTYDCNLCAITFGKFTEDALWKSFREHADLEMNFIYKDEFEKAFASKWLPKFEFPIILSESNTQLEVFVSTPDLNALSTSEELIEEIKKRLAPH